MAYQRRKKNKNYLFMNTGTRTTPDWKRDTKSTDFAIAYNPQSETYDFIADELPTTETTSFQPSIERTLYAYIGEPLYDYLILRARSFARGTDAETQIMIVYQETSPTGENLADQFDVELSWGTDDMVAGTLAYTVNLKGTPTHGTASIVESQDADGNRAYTVTFSPSGDSSSFF